MWTGPDLERAVADVEAESLLSAGDVHSFVSRKDLAGDITQGVFNSKGAVIQYKRPPCSTCSAVSPSVAHLQSVLAGVMRNRRLMCKQ